MNKLITCRCSKSNERKKTSYLTVLGFIIRARRENSGLTRHQFAEITGFSESWLKKIESGFVAISIDRLRQIASCYQTNACTLIEDADQLKEELEAQGIKVKESIVNKESDILYKTISENTKGKTGAVSIASSLSTIAYMPGQIGVPLAVGITLGQLLKKKNSAE